MSEGTYNSGNSRIRRSEEEILDGALKIMEWPEKIKKLRRLVEDAKRKKKQTSET